MTIMIWVLVHQEGWRRFEYTVPPDACALIEAGLKSLNPFSPHPEYVQYMYDIGGYGGEPVIFWSCH